MSKWRGVVRAESKAANSGSILSYRGIRDSHSTIGRRIRGEAASLWKEVRRRASNRAGARTYPAARFAWQRGSLLMSLDSMRVICVLCWLSWRRSMIGLPSLTRWFIRGAHLLAQSPQTCAVVSIGLAER